MKEPSLKERVVKNSFWSFIAGILNRMGALIFTIVLTRFLLPEGFGIYSIVLSTAMIFYTFTDIGINQAATRYISYSLEKNKKKLSAYYSYLFKIKFLLSVITSSLLFVLAYPISFYFFKNPVLFLPLLVSSFYIFIVALETFYSNLFYAFEKSELTAMKDFIEQTSRITLALLVFYLLASSYHIIGIFFSYLLISLFLLFFNLHYVKKINSKMFKKSKEKIDKKRVRRFVGFLTIATISGVFFTYIDSVMLGLFLQPEYVGYYRAAYSLVLGISGMLLSPTAVFLTYFTKINRSKSPYLLNQSFRLLSVLSLPCLFGLIVLGRYFIRLFFGYAFLPATLPLYFLSVLLFPLISVAPFLSLFSSQEKTEVFAKLILIASVLNIILNFIFIKLFLTISPIWATAGAALATVISWFFYLFSFVYMSKKKFNTAVSFKHLIKPVIASIVMSVFLIFLIKFIGDMTLFSGIFLVFLGAFVYFTVLFLLKGFTTRDLNLIKLLFSYRKKQS